MSRTRVHQLAQELGLDSRAVLERLKELGESAYSAHSLLEGPVVRKLRTSFKKPAGHNPAPTQGKD
jgi:translation initiation factor IF-2